MIVVVGFVLAFKHAFADSPYQNNVKAKAITTVKATVVLPTPLFTDINSTSTTIIVCSSFHMLRPRLQHSQC